MPRKARVAPGGLVYHVLNRAAGRADLFRNDDDFAAFERVMVEAHARVPLRILSYCVLSNHWHFVVWPESDGEVSAFFRWLANTHAMRWRVSHRTVGYGHLYQGRFKSFPVERDAHVRTVCRYVERNALTATLVKRAEDWRWGSLWARRSGGAETRSILSDWPVDRPRDWVAAVNRPLNAKEVERLEVSERRGRPFGSDAWVGRLTRSRGLEHTTRGEGRPKKQAGKHMPRGN